MNESCPIIDTGSLLSRQSDTYSSLASIYAPDWTFIWEPGDEWYRWQESSHEIDNDEERCHIKSEGATVNIPAQRRIFLASTPLQGLLFFWLQVKFIPLPRSSPPHRTVCRRVSDTFALVSFVCQLILPQTLNLCFPKVVEILAVKGGWGEKGGRGKAF